MEKKKELWVGMFVLMTFFLIGVFLFLMGVFKPFTREKRFTVIYDFAGGVEIGSPVRVAGVRVGKVENLNILPPEGDGAIAITISVSDSASEHLRESSKFYINMAGLIGERYVEITRGSQEGAVLKPGSVIRGIDPPRIDQLLSQGYGFFGKLLDFWEDNEALLSDFLKELHLFINDTNKLLKSSDAKKWVTLIENLNQITADIKVVSKKLNTPETENVLNKLYDVIGRIHEVDPKTLRKFLQEEGIRSRIF